MNLNIPPAELEEMERAIKQRISEALNEVPVRITFKDILQLAATIELHNAVKELVSQRDELLAALTVLLKMVEDGDYTQIELNQARDAIKKAEGK